MHVFASLCAGYNRVHALLLQGPAQARNLRDSLVETKSDIVVKVSYSHFAIPPAFYYGIDLLYSLKL